MNISIRYIQELPEEGRTVYASPTGFRRMETPHKDMIYRRLYEGEMNVYTIGFESSTPDKALIDRRLNGQIHFHYIVGGQGTYNGRPVGTGDGFVCLPHIPHSLISSADDPLRFYWIAFYGKRAEACVASLGFCAEQLFFTFDWEDELRAVLDDILYREQSDRNLTLLMESCLLRCLSFHKPLIQPKPSQSRMLEHVSRAESYIHRQLGVISCDKVSRQLNLSRKYLNNLFVRFRGVSLQNFIMTIRMNHAADLLISGDYIPKEVAAIAGYTDYAQFSKMFKKYQKYAPIDYIRARQQERSTPTMQIPSTPIDIRPARPEDLPRIMEIYAEARGYMRAHGNLHQWNGAYPSAEIVKEDMAAERFYVAADDREIFGVFCFFLGDDPTYREIDGAWCNTLPYGVIHRIAVGENAHRRGIASRCFAWAYARCGNLKIDTHADNYPMQHALEKNGFRRCGIIRLENGDPRIAYQKCE